MIEDYLYLANPHDIGFVNVRGVFEDPERVAEFTCDGNQCYDDTMDYPIPGDKINYSTLDLSFLVDENLNNYKELHDWISGLGFPKNHQQFADLQATSADRFPGSTASSAATGSKQTPAPLAEGGTYSDATLTVLSSKNIAKTEIRFSNVYPISLGSLSYDVKASDVDYLQVQASFGYLNYDIVQISTT